MVLLSIFFVKGEEMAGRKRSVLKRQRQEEKRRKRNKMVKSAIKTLIKKVKKAALEKSPELENYLREAIKAIDKAASKGIIHKNTAARKKSRLQTFVNKISFQESK